MTRVFVGLIVLMSSVAASCGGGAGETTANMTPPAPQTSQTIVARNLKFDLKVLSAPANQKVSLTLVNRDSGALHNLGIYTDARARERIFVGTLIKGGESITYSFTSPSPGAYHFRCDVHPDMKGTFFAIAP